MYNILLSNVKLGDNLTLLYNVIYYISNLLYIIFKMCGDFINADIFFYLNMALFLKQVDASVYNKESKFERHCVC